MGYMEELKERLPLLYAEMQKDMKLFKRESYPDHFAAYRQQHAQTFSTIELMLQEAGEDAEAGIQEIALALVECVEELLAQQKGRIARENEQLNLNMVTVLYIIPAVFELGTPEAGRLTEAICERWNETLKGSQIKPADFASIQGGFRTKMCYITTAVCRSLNKPEDCYELNLLKSYRDGYLSGSEGGEELILEYYNIAPTIVKRIDRCGDAGEKYRAIWERFLKPCVSLIEAGDNEQCRVLYTDMVESLHREYMEEYRYG